MNLSTVRAPKKASENRKRVGRGISAGQGKTAGRGTKGQGSRSGGSVRLYHQGGNLPFYRRLPFMRGQGFTPPNQVEYNVVNLEQLEDFEANSEITPELLSQSLIIRKPKLPVVLLGRGEVNVPLKVRLQRIS